MANITRERAERIARGHACPECQEYTYRKLSVKPALKSVTEELGVTWIAIKVCGVCGYQCELGIQSDGDIAFET